MPNVAFVFLIVEALSYFALKTKTEPAKKKNLILSLGESKLLKPQTSLERMLPCVVEVVPRARINLGAVAGNWPAIHAYKVRLSYRLVWLWLGSDQALLRRSQPWLILSLFKSPKLNEQPKQPKQPEQPEQPEPDLLNHHVF
jgi:hypothetical protein